MSAGGSHALDNLVPACAPCNRDKSSGLQGILSTTTINDAPNAITEEDLMGFVRAGWRRLS